MHRLEAAIDIALEGHLTKHLNLGRFVFRLERQIGIIPIAPNAQPLKALSLGIDIAEGIGFGPLAQGQRGQILTLSRTHALEHLQLDG